MRMDVTSELQLLPAQRGRQTKGRRAGRLLWGFHMTEALESKVPPDPGLALGTQSRAF